MLQFPLRLSILPQLRRDPPPSPSLKDRLPLLSRPLDPRDRKQSLPAWRQHTGIRTLDQEVLQYLPLLLPKRRSLSYPSKSAPV